MVVLTLVANGTKLVPEESFRALTGAIVTLGMRHIFVTGATAFHHVTRHSDQLGCTVKRATEKHRLSAFLRG